MSAADKLYSTIRADAARLGIAVWRSDPADGHPRFFACWASTVTLLQHLDDLERFVGNVGRARPEVPQRDWSTYSAAEVTRHDRGTPSKLRAPA